MSKFWKWVRNKAPDDASDTPESRTLYLNGTIAEESWFDDDVTPALFASDLNSGTGDITVWINSPGGDCFAAARIYNMLRDYKGKVTVKVDGLAASAASVIAMAGDTVLVSPVSMMMVHNPATVAVGDHAEMEKAIAMLEEVKNSIINAYQTKTGLSRQKLSQLMEDETWMNARKAVELHFADGILEREGTESTHEQPEAMSFARYPFVRQVTNRISEHYHIETQDSKEPEGSEEPAGTVSTAALYERLKTIKEKF